MMSEVDLQLTDLSRRTGFNGAVNPEHLLFVIMSRKVSNHPEIFNCLEAAGCDLEGMRSAIINVFNEQAEAARAEKNGFGDIGPLTAPTVRDSEPQGVRKTAANPQTAIGHLISTARI